MYKIKAVLQSPLMIGGKTLNSNYRESRDYIPGSVVRAAYAKALVERCACEQKNYWLDYKGQDVCKKCSFKSVCENFAHIKFPVLYPLGSSPYPVTARKKKYENEGEHSILDVLKSRLTTQEKADGESDWIRPEGFHCNGVPVRLIHSAITRTAIDYRRNASKDGSLYTQNVISEKYLDSGQELADVVFSGDICLTQDMKKELEKIKTLHVGADVTRGFGICRMSLEESKEDDTPEKMAERIREFHHGINTEKPFITLDLMTDAYLGLEEIGEDSLSQTNFSDGQMIAFLEEKIGLPKDRYRLWKAYKFQEILRGFDTSKATEKEMRRQGHLVVKAGAVFVYRSLEKEIDAKELLELEQCGIGKHVEHGFGKIRICDSFHIKYDVLKGDDRNG